MGIGEQYEFQKTGQIMPEPQFKISFPWTPQVDAERDARLVKLEAAIVKIRNLKRIIFKYQWNRNTDLMFESPTQYFERNDIEGILKELEQ